MRLPALSTTRVGLAAVLVTFVALGALHAAFVPAFLPSDETSHAGQALVVGGGELPALDTEVPGDIPGMKLQFEIRQQTYTANHPPLYYAIVGLPMRLAVDQGSPIVGFDVARLLTVLMTSVGAVATFWAARLLLPSRRELWVLAAALAVLVPAVPRFAGAVHNDGFGLAVGALAVAAAAELLVRGPSRRRLAVAMVVAALLALTRAIGLGGVGLLAAATVLAVVVHRPGPWRQRLLPAAASGAAVGAAALVAGGWFWWRNAREYGDIAGSAYNLERFGYSRRGSTLESLLDVELTVALHRQVWGRFFDSAELAVGWGAWPGAVVVALVAIGAVLLVVRGIRRLVAVRRDHQRDHGRDHDGGRPEASGALSRVLGHLAPWVPDWDPSQWGRALAWAGVVGWSAVVWISTLGYFASGGGLHGRYVFMAFPALALVAAAALGSLPLRRFAAAPMLVVATMVTVALVWAGAFAEALGPAGARWYDAMEHQARVWNGLPPVAVWVPFALAIVGGVVTCWSLARLASQDR